MSSLYDQLAAYTLAHTDQERFLHQHVVDAHAAEHAHANTKPITTAFALIGLYLFVVRNFAGREIQRAHSELARLRREWPTFPIPTEKPSMSLADVLEAPAGPARDLAIQDWARAVWAIWHREHAAIKGLAEKLLPQRK